MGKPTIGPGSVVNLDIGMGHTIEISIQCHELTPEAVIIKATVSLRQAILTALATAYTDGTLPLPSMGDIANRFGFEDHSLIVLAFQELAAAGEIVWDEVLGGWRLSYIKVGDKYGRQAKDTDG